MTQEMKELSIKIVRIRKGKWNMEITNITTSGIYRNEYKSKNMTKQAKNSSVFYGMIPMTRESEPAARLEAGRP